GSTDFQIRNDTAFPDDGSCTIEVAVSKQSTSPLYLRVPQWCDGFVATLDGKSYRGKPGGLLSVAANWSGTQTVKVTLPMPVQKLAGGKSYPDAVAFARGPQVFAAELSDGVQPQIGGLDD